MHALELVLQNTSRLKCSLCRRLQPVCQTLALMLPTKSWDEFLLRSWDLFKTRLTPHPLTTLSRAAGDPSLELLPSLMPEPLRADLGQIPNRTSRLPQKKVHLRERRSWAQAVQDAPNIICLAQQESQSRPKIQPGKKSTSKTPNQTLGRARRPFLRTWCSRFVSRARPQQPKPDLFPKWRYRPIPAQQITWRLGCIAL